MSSLPTVRRFLRWWLGELRWFVPPAVLRLFTGAGRHLFVTARNGEVEIAQGAGFPQERLGAVPLGTSNSDEFAKAMVSLAGARLRKRHVIAVVPSEKVLRRSLVVPAAARKNLRSVLEFQITKTTPFEPEDVVLDFRVNPQQRHAGKLEVSLAVTTRGAVEEAATLASRAGRAPVAVWAEATGDDDGTGFDFTPADHRQSGARLWVGLNAGLAVAALAIVAYGAALPFAYQRSALQELSLEIAQMRAKAKNVAAQRERSVAAAERRNFLASRRQATVLHTQLLDDLTRRIPDDAWLVLASTSGTTVRIQGFAPSASSLMTTLERAPEFEGLSALSKVVWDRNAKLESFQFSLQATPGVR